MSDIWPDNLVEELAYRRCLIFLGSGISATAKNDAGESPDTWGAFLQILLERYAYSEISGTFILI